MSRIPDSERADAGLGPPSSPGPGAPRPLRSHSSPCPASIQWQDPASVPALRRADLTDTKE